MQAISPERPECTFGVELGIRVVPEHLQVARQMDVLCIIREGSIDVEVQRRCPIDILQRQVNVLRVLNLGRLLGVVCDHEAAVSDGEATDGEWFSGRLGICHEHEFGCRSGACDRGRAQALAVPVPGRVSNQLYVRLYKLDGADGESAAQQRPQLGAGGDGSAAGKFRGTEARIIGNPDVFETYPEAAPNAQRDLVCGHGAAELGLRALQDQVAVLFDDAVEGEG